MKKLKTLISPEVDTPDGIGVIEQIYITELGNIMLKIYYKDSGLRINRKISSLESFLENSEFKLFNRTNN